MATYEEALSRAITAEAAFIEALQDPTAVMPPVQPVNHFDLRAEAELLHDEWNNIWADSMIAPFDKAAVKTSMRGLRHEYVVWNGQADQQGLWALQPAHSALDARYRDFIWAYTSVALHL